MANKHQPIDWDKVELYLKSGASQQKIAKALMISHDTLRRRVLDKYGVEYAEFAHSLQSTGELLIEAKQLQKALEGNVQMLIWLGKIRCGQREPDLVSTIPPLQSDIDKDHIIMQLQHEISELKSKIENL